MSESMQERKYKGEKQKDKRRQCMNTINDAEKTTNRKKRERTRK